MKKEQEIKRKQEGERKRKQGEVFGTDSDQNRIA